MDTHDAPGSLAQPGQPSAMRQTAAKNENVIFGAGTPDVWTASWGGGLARIGLSEGEVVGAEPRPIFELSGPDALAGFDAVVSGERTVVKYRGTYPGADRQPTTWDCTLSKNGRPGNWNFVAVFVPEPDAPAAPAYQASPDDPWYAKLFGPAVSALNHTPIGKIVTLTLCLAFLYGTWAWWRPEGHWKDTVSLTKVWLDTRRVEALARIEEARAADDDVRITVQDGGSVSTDQADVDQMTVEADEATVTERPAP